ncbi:DNA-binding transcriptional LysR family regulator [Phyllobacterium ifriqiyense]|uniref:DNA-binding transcriptional LysR family regulator n=1 Tax=Phyllobacterium ifriqiyense TaxID=314238 RepID=A0ABU0SGT1_9HYPH|nr:LysR family transcriptional regulator [Phyllobacterium ifriqiyense]MDQ0999115.1 DNA-binding transcriptional LysR family regulator [Phyllobacterium ifriqiyense]
MHSRLFDIRQLEAFAAVMSAGSVTGAARLLGRSQPAVSRLIQDLEADLGYALLHRSGPRITPTSRGLQFHAEVERHLASLTHIRERANAIGLDEPISLTIAATPSLAAGVLPRALAAVSPDLIPRHLHIQALAAENVVQAVLARSADFGIASLPLEHPGLDVHWIADAPCVVALAVDDPLAGNDVVSLADLAERRIITLANPFRLRHRIDEALARAGVAPQRIIDVNSSMTALTMVRVGLGVALVEPATVVGVPLEGIVMRTLDQTIPFLFGAISPAAHPLSPTVAAVIDAARAVALAMPGCRLRELGGDGALAEAIYGNSIVPEGTLS